MKFLRFIWHDPNPITFFKTENLGKCFTRRIYDLKVLFLARKPEWASRHSHLDQPFGPATWTRHDLKLYTNHLLDLLSTRLTVRLDFASEEPSPLDPSISEQFINYQLIYQVRAIVCLTRQYFIQNAYRYGLSEWPIGWPIAVQLERNAFDVNYG